MLYIQSDISKEHLGLGPRSTTIGEMHVRRAPDDLNCNKRTVINGKVDDDLEHLRQ